MTVTRIHYSSILIAALCANTSATFASDDYHPVIDPAEFQTTVDNPYFPLLAGTVNTFVEKDGAKTAQNTVEVTSDTKMIAGVRCVVVHDTVKQGDALLEDTYDWYAQAKDGTVWYFGEDTTEFKPGGGASKAGSWEAGVDGAQPGIVMPAHPVPGQPYRQEYLAGKAEDMGQVVAVGAATTVPAGTYTDVVKTKEWSMLESGTESKWYARGVGFVREEATDGTVATLVSTSKK